MDAPLDKVLYIDDEINNLLLFKETFDLDFIVFTTISTIEAREIIAENDIKVVISDLRMPDESGIEFIKSVSPKFPNIIYIILTAFVDINSVLNAINLGTTFRYLLKPWDSNQVKETINSAIYSYNLKLENLNLIDQLKDKNLALENAMVQIKERETQFYNIFFYSSDGIMIFNKEGKVLVANPAFFDIMELSGDNELELSMIFKGENLSFLTTDINYIFDQATHSSEYQFELNDGSIKYIEIHSSLIDFQGGQAVLSILRDITDRRQVAHKIFNAIIHAEEHERNRLARDLHDGIGPILSTIKMYFEWLSDNSRHESHEQILKLANESINEAILQIRTISHNLSPHLLEKFGLVSGLQSYIDLLKKASTIEFNLNSNLKKRLRPAIELTLYRALKECINNTIKHAKAKNVFIVVSIEGKKLMVVYSDDGVGFDTTDETGQTKGIGLYNIKNRINSLGGSLEILSAPGIGTRVKIEIKNVN